MKKQRFSILVIGLFLAVLFMNAVMVVPKVEAKGTETRIRLSGSVQHPNAKGKAKYKVDGANREFQVEIENVKYLAGKSVDVFVNNAKVGSFRIGALGNGRLNRSTERGQAVPNISSGSGVQIKTRAGVVIVSGKF